MNPIFSIPAIAGAALVTLMACSQAPPMPQSGIPDTASSPTSATSTEAAKSWADILETASAPAGWLVYPCDNPLLLCVEADGELVGTVEHLSYPLETVELQTPVEASAEEEFAFLQAWVAEHYDAIERDRQVGYANAIFAADTPTEISVGDLPGLRYGYSLTHANGTPIDEAVGYVTTDGERLHVFVTGVISQDPAGSISDPAALAEFKPHLDTIIQELLL
ncbi:MAG: hypothetical protein F6K04_23395 [Leptolyngbya sp. SIO4C5]|nr:hypothetical protein [Leptolyngbya sp. SIO4C5]